MYDFVFEILWQYYNFFWMQCYQCFFVYDVDVVFGYEVFLFSWIFVGDSGEKVWFYVCEIQQCVVFGCCVIGCYV